MNKLTTLIIAAAFSAPAMAQFPNDGVRVGMDKAPSSHEVPQSTGIDFTHDGVRVGIDRKDTIEGYDGPKVADDFPNDGVRVGLGA